MLILTKYMLAYKTVTLIMAKQQPSFCWQDNILLKIREKKNRQA